MIKKAVYLVVVLFVVVACSGSDDSGSGGGSNSDGFNRQSMLINWADNIIIPVYQGLNSELGNLVTAKNIFVANPDQTNLDAFRTAWKETYKVWQYAEMFNIGKAEAINYHFQMNIYPTSVSDVENNVASGTYDLTHPNNNDAVGFPAVDYLLYGLAQNDAAILEKYTTNTNALGYKTYLSDVVDQMKSLTQIVLNDWTTVYRDQFVSSSANTATSSVNKLTNDFIFYYEKGLRANKVGIPAGIFSTNPLPEKVEAFYNQEISKELNLDALQAVQDFFNGKAYGSSLINSSFDEYLQYLNTVKNGEDLDVLINNQIDLARTKVQLLNNNYYEQVTTDNQKMTQAYDELQKVVVLLKVDMVQAMNISVDYVDADGD
ncbi:imelysin family protein [Xanthomarina sp. F1114]|uniref:imelysin family protein n=1 Tax=Xanthomarina sp. F1114 TaxID=2996019 RepID=UPI00225E6E30|nr:imelysin family protein [Xanthomarina sp. F1114]MCX7547519.1 imelysin family protein [Xanthomarina sp. F1114]